ncbi:hypothetical protein X764_11870 [Mesorhizobium sp. LSHC440A00]|nr:hypothetical protein X764_11870 [Mesorhizobium sp. LSHC440A00]
MIAMAGISGMDQDKQEAFEELVGPAGSALERLLLLAARRVHRTKSKLRGTVRKRVPFLLPTRGPLSDLDSGIEMSLHVLSRDPLVGHRRRRISIAASRCRCMCSAATRWCSMSRLAEPVRSIRWRPLAGAWRDGASPS